jgi:hypothetical protein
MSSFHAFAVWPGSQPISVGWLENPYPGIDGSTRWNASEARPPCAVGFVSGPTVSSSSTNEPGQPWVMISGSASWCGDRTWTKCTSTPSISVVNCGSLLTFASNRRQSYRLTQYFASAFVVASCTPWERSSTSSAVGQLTAATRRRRSNSFCCGTETRNGRIAAAVTGGAALATPLLSAVKPTPAASPPCNTLRREGPTPSVNCIRFSHPSAVTGNSRRTARWSPQ